MLSTLRFRPSPPMVVALVAYFVATVMCLGQAGAASAAVDFNVRERVTFTTFTCSSVPILVEGVLHTQNGATYTPSGVSHYGGHSGFHGTGVDANGNEYRFNTSSNGHGSVHFDDSPPIISTNVIVMNAVRLGELDPDDDMRFRVLYHTTVNANGEQTVRIERSEEVCH